MKIEWVQPKRQRDVHELSIDKIDMGWVEPCAEGGLIVSCMWMSDANDSRVKAGLLVATDYPEEHTFATVEEAKHALLETATVMYIGGWRGRA